jgi:hypothetical protein
MTRYLTIPELAVELRFVNATGAPNVKQAHAYVTKHLPPSAVKRRGRRLLIDRAAVEASLEGRT